MRTKSFFLFLTAVFFILAAVRTNSQPLVNQNDIKFETPSIATLVGQDGLIMRTQDGGATWEVQNPGITNVLNAMDYVQYESPVGLPVSMHFAVGENGVILKSIDNGLTWELKTSATNYNLNDIAIYSPEMIFICGDNGTLLKSVDMGETYEKIDLPITERINSISFADPKSTVTSIVAVLAGDEGKLLGTINTNEWFEIITGSNEDLYSASFMGSNIIATGSNGTLLKSADCGWTWTSIVSGTVLNVFDVKFLSMTTAVASSENGLILRTEDAGDTWTSITTPVEADLFAVNFANENIGISIGSEGTEIYSIDGGITWITAPAANLLPADRKIEAKLSQNYPNPFNPATIINYSISDNSTVSLKIYDMTGREVRTMVNTYQAPGSYSVKFDASNLSSGIYFYALRVNTGKNEITKTMRMILTK